MATVKSERNFSARHMFIYFIAVRSDEFPRGKEATYAHGRLWVMKRNAKLIDLLKVIKTVIGFKS